MPGDAIDVLIAGAGVFGLTAALALRERGHRVRVLAPGPLPHPAASSNDISKIVRLDYGDDRFYSMLAADSLRAWPEWNARFGTGLFHRTGLACLTSEPMAAGGFEHDSFALLAELGWELERLDTAAIRRRFPAFAECYADGYFNPHDGWVASGRVLARLAAEARAAGVELVDAACTGVVRRGGRITGVATATGEHHAELVVVAAGAWTPVLLPWLAATLRPVGQPVLHLRAPDDAVFRPPALPVWCSDLARTGWYGFPAQEDGALKIGHHGPGRAVSPAPGVTGEVAAQEVEMFRAFVATHLPGLAGAEVMSTRLCLYCDTPDHDFLIDHDPDHPGLVVAAGGSGHAFKFAPILGTLIADVVERRVNPHAHRFRWRAGGAGRAESSRRR